MKFNKTDMLRAKVLRGIVFAKQQVKAGTIIEVTGWQALQMTRIANPSIEIMEEVEPRPVTNRDTEIIISTPDPVSDATVATTKAASKPRKPAVKKKLVFDIPEDDGV